MDLPIPVDIEIRYGARDEDRLFVLCMRMVGASEPQLECRVRTDSCSHPQVEAVWHDDLLLPLDLRDRFIEILYDGFLRCHLVEDSPSRIEYRHPDLRQWLGENFYHSDATRLARRLSAHIGPVADRQTRPRVIVTD